MPDLENFTFFISFLFVCFLPNYLPISILFSIENHPVLSKSKLGPFYNNLLKYTQFMYGLGSFLSNENSPIFVPNFAKKHPKRQAFIYIYHVNVRTYWDYETGEFKGSQLGTFCPQAIVYCYLEFKLCYLRNLKLFSIRVKELFELTVLWKKAKRQLVLLFLKAFSWETDLWVTLGDFAVKKHKIGKGNLYLTENPLTRNENNMVYVR